MANVLRSGDGRVSVGEISRYPAGHVVLWAEADGRRVYRVSVPGVSVPVPFDTEAEAVQFAERMQREADYRGRVKARRRRAMSWRCRRIEAGR